MKKNLHAHKLGICVLAAVLLAALTGRAAELREMAAGKWLLSNGLVEVEIHPARGGRVSQFRDLAFPEPLIRNANSQGLFVDHLTEQNWPGELWERAYDAKALADVGVEVALEVTTEIKGEWDQSRQPRSRGVILRKIYRLADGERGLRVEHRIENPTDQGKQFALWVQNIQQLGADPRQNTTLRAAKSGVYRFKMPEQRHGEAWVRYRDSLAAWYTVMDPESGQAIAYFQDWDFLDSHYTAGSAYTIEWFMTPVSIQPGGSWTTHARMISRQVTSDLCAISPGLWAGASLSEDESAVQLTVGDEAAAEPMTVEGTLFHRAPDAERFAGLNLAAPFTTTIQAGANEIALPKGVKPPLGFSATIKAGENVLVVHEYLGGASFPDNEPLPGYPPIWQVEIPEKTPDLPRPDVLEFAADAGERVLIVHGSMTLGVSLADPLAVADLRVEHAYEMTEMKETGIRGFPASYDEIMQRRLMVMANVDHRLLRATDRLLLKDFVEAGGGLLVLGGTATTTLSAERNPQFPVAVAPASAMVTTRMPVRSGLKSVPELDTAWFPEMSGAIFWDAPANGILAAVNGQPLVVVAYVGEGRIVYCGLSAMGPIRPEGYWQSPAWGELVRTMVAIAVGKE
ncbi:MAG: hypothetical protein K9N49_01085 [Candidatus Marinimicrobia bacterium]|nr:hypothetical protein [Candidatus Neomarinimicrobiota bacterium]